VACEVLLCTCPVTNLAAAAAAAGVVSGAQKHELQAGHVLKGHKVAGSLMCYSCLLALRANAAASFYLGGGILLDGATRFSSNCRGPEALPHQSELFKSSLLQWNPRHAAALHSPKSHAVQDAQHQSVIMNCIIPLYKSGLYHCRTQSSVVVRDLLHCREVAPPERSESWLSKGYRGCTRDSL
jgi:hypothetical protein